MGQPGCGGFQASGSLEKEIFMRFSRLPVLLSLPVVAVVLLAVVLLPRHTAIRIGSEKAAPSVPADGDAALAGKTGPTPSPGQTSAGATAPFDIPPEVAGHEKEWPLANHDYSNTRAAVGSSINAGNVAKLKVAWTASLQ